MSQFTSSGILRRVKNTGLQRNSDEIILLITITQYLPSILLLFESWFVVMGVKHIIVFHFCYIFQVMGNSTSHQTEGEGNMML